MFYETTATINRSILEITRFSSTKTYKYWLITMTIVPLITMVGNLLVVISVYQERTLRNTTNYFIVSLAVADISLSIIVMPISIWVEVNNGLWNLGIAICDAFIVADVTFCTASIINLTVISIDRYVAVTMPLKYSQYKGCTRIWLTISLTWLISFAIALPMAFGLNHRKNRTAIETCTFNNEDFIIWSSLGSFYIPSVVTICLYFQIFKKIRERANIKIHTRPNAAPNNTRKSSFGDATETLNDNKQTFDLSHRHCPNQKIFENCFSNVGSKRMNDSCSSVWMLNNGLNDTIKRSITRETWVSTISQTSELSHSLLTLYGDQIECKSEDWNGHPKPLPQSPECVPSTLTDIFTDMQQFRLHLKNRIKVAKKDEHFKIFKIPMCIRSRLSKLYGTRASKMENKRSTRREKKAIKTLFIVLAVFLVCWAPYFAVNLTIGISVKFDWITVKEFLEPGYATVTWFGYINSFLNPIIYTIFNAEFRNAFKKILTCT